MRDRIERYAVEVADALDLDRRRDYPRISSTLKVLQGRGDLVSRFEPATERSGSGLGRRYYQLAARG